MNNDHNVLISKIPHNPLIVFYFRFDSSNLSNRHFGPFENLIILLNKGKEEDPSIVFFFKKNKEIKPRYVDRQSSQWIDEIIANLTDQLLRQET